jgi:hypothetical protein
MGLTRSAIALLQTIMGARSLLHLLDFDKLSGNSINAQRQGAIAVGNLHGSLIDSYQLSLSD